MPLAERFFCNFVDSGRSSALNITRPEETKASYSCTTFFILIKGVHKR